MAKGKENWKQQAQQMRKQSRAVEAPTYQLGFGQMPDLPGHYPHNPNNAQQLQQKLDYQQALKARQAWLNTGNRPGQNYPDLPSEQQPAQRGTRLGQYDPGSGYGQSQPYTPPQSGVQPQIPFRGHQGHGTGGYGGYPTVGLPQPTTPRRGGGRNRNNRYPSLTY